MSSSAAAGPAARPVIVLDRLPSTYAAVRLAAGSGWPHWATWSRDFVSVSCTRAETSVFCEARLVPAGIPAERDFAAWIVRGPLDFSAVGIMAAIAAPLAANGIPILAVSTYDTDVVLVREAQGAAAEAAWRAAGITVAADGDATSASGVMRGRVAPLR